MPPDAAGLEKALCYQFEDITLMERALTRKAYALERAQKGELLYDQDALRTLGDAVLRLALVDMLMSCGYDSRGDITIRKSELESEGALAGVARRIQLGHFILLGEGERAQGAGDNPYVLAETLEALLGAVYLDGGFISAKHVVATLWGSKL